MPINAGGSTEFIMALKQPGDYSISCSDSQGHTASAKFNMPEPITISEPQEAPQAGSQAAGQEVPEPVKMPGLADFQTAGMWMYFDQGTSSLSGYGVPQQCLPGVNYSQAGGTSSFNISPNGKLEGTCALDYSDGAGRLRGTMTGFWDE